MKKLNALLLIGMLLIAGCKATPEKPVVIQKDMEQMIDKAQKDTEENESKGLREQYDIPDEYKYEAQGTDGKLNISVDAAVIVPEGSAMPIYSVKAADFTQQQVDAFWNALCGDAEMWEMPQQQSKEEIQQNIVGWKKFMKEDGEEDNPEALEYLAQLEEALQTAPDKVEEVRSDGKLKLMDIYADSINHKDKIASYWGLRAYEKENGRTFFVENNNDLKEAYYVETKDKDGNATGGGGFNVRRLAIMDFRDIRNPAGSINFGFSDSIHVQDDTVVDEKVGLAPADARKTVQELLDKTNSNMVVDSIYLQDDEQKGYVDDEVRPAQRYAYKVCCVREVNDIPCSFISGSSGSEETTGEIPAFMAPTWEYESLEIMINKDGIYSINWLSPLEIMEIVNEDSQLKPFSEIQEIFEKMMFTKYGYAAQAEGISGYNFEIDRVTLSLQRIIEQNSIENGLLVPAWNFYGRVTQKLDAETQNVMFGESVMSINAIDGSIIDPSKGY